MALNQKVYIFSPSSGGEGNYTFSIFLQNGSFEKYLKQGDFVQDTAGNRYQITTWSGFPNDFSDGNTVTTTFVDTDVLPVEDVNFDSDWFTPDLEDIRPPLQTDGNLSNISIFSGQNFEYTVTATWDSSPEAFKAQVGDHVADSSGTVYEITFIDEVDRFSVPCRMKEVEEYGNPPNSGTATLYRPTPLQGLFTGKQFSQTQITAVRNRDNYITDDNASTSGGGGGGASLSFEATCTASENVGDAVYLSGPNTVSKANASDISTAPVIGFISEKQNATTCIVQTEGELTYPGSLVADTVYFLDTTNGSITSTPPTGSGTILQELGTSLDSTSLLIKLRREIERT